MSETFSDGVVSFEDCDVEESTSDELPVEDDSEEELDEESSLSLGSSGSSDGSSVPVRSPEEVLGLLLMSTLYQFAFFGL